MSSHVATQPHILANNAEVIDIEPNVGVVLAKQDNIYHPYAIWGIYHKEGENQWTCFSGEYFDDLNEAALRYLDRVALQQRKNTESRLANVIQAMLWSKK